ncbi:anthrax toxin lethal factor-related metalloendopeptidase [Lederbergia panacisoli]|uniref:anthrax toxin lethal factor-related metalloendopeptidase n=1 Tax=Lederbergia panacisoli TaxID=1255251 RepID=UPI00214BC877|nr:toxin [Lederbergia panacisoli]MCR2820171.1 toxin [Lederbergia panacisoli]
MRKWLIVPPILFIIIFLLSTTSNATYEGIPLSESDLYESLALQSSDFLKDIIVLPEDSYNQKDAAEMIKRLDHLPSSILAQAKKKKVKVILFDGKLTDNASAAHLKGKIPRGYPTTITWDEVPGIGGSSLVLVKIGSSHKGMGHGSVLLEYHELAHTLYHLAYNDKIEAFKRIWLKEANQLFPNNSYFLNYDEEYFAESFALYFYSDDTKNKIKKLAPETFEFITNLQ